MLKNNNSAIITRMAKHSLVSNKKRNGVMIFAIFLSAFLLFTVLTVGETWLHMQRIQNIRMRGGDFDAMIYGGFTEKQKEICENNPEIATVGIEGMAGWAVKSENDSTLHSTFIWADNISWKVLHKPAVEWVKGNYPQKDNEVMTTKDALEDCGLGNLDVGDSFTLTYADNNGEHTKKFIISGLWGGYGDTKIFYVTKSFFEQSGFTIESVGRGFLYVKFKSSIVTDKVQSELEEKLELGSKQRFLITSETSNSVQILLGMVGLVLVICFNAYLLIYNILYLSVSGNIRYYGLLQTIGMTKRQVYQLVKRQMLMVGSIGTGLGLMGGIITAFWLIPSIVKTLGIRQNDIEIIFHPRIFLLCIVLVGITVYFGSRKPAKLAVKVSPVEALGYRPVSGKKVSHKTGKGKIIWRMAWEQLNKDKKKTAIVILALGTCLSFFLCMVTLIESQGPRTIVRGYMDSDIVIKNDTMQMEQQEKWKPLMDQSFLKQLEERDGVKEIHPIVNSEIVIPLESDFMEEWMRRFYDVWMTESYSEKIKLDYQKHPEKCYSFLVGIDQSQFQYLNATLEKPIDEKEFLEGKTCIIYGNSIELNTKQITGQEISFYSYGDKKRTAQLTIQGITEDSYYADLLGMAPTLIVSDTFVKGFERNPYVSKVAISYEEEFDETTENNILQLMKESPYQRDFSSDSKIKEMKEVSKAQGNMMGIGMGITFILAFIGIMNYVNTSVGNVQSRQKEFSIMESIGMSPKQVRHLLLQESLLFAGGSVLFTMTVGMGVTYYLYQSMNYMRIDFEVPVLPLVLSIVLVMAVCSLIPLAAYWNLERKKSVVERIREFE